ncbi:hypothetical protein MKW94_025086 [Papaver nudicaule]|uniref:Peptidase A1 domain-containing protein n=1 Tax=Papaver nudicaule TaxID=74823 RepID=A0AA42B368_PAPNU|nr:hypothetical protein [Papaver nudicaule]
MGDVNLPEKDSLEYHAVMVHRDKIFHGRALAENGGDDSKLLTFSNAIETSHIPSLAYLHYANVSLGTPSLSFLVALDTGTSLLWVPCDCTDCVRSLVTSTPGVEINLNIYSTNSSSTSKDVACSSSLCERRNQCSESQSQCPYQVSYDSATTSSGILVEDVLRLKTDNHKPKDFNARVTFGCGRVQTGFYFNGTARNGLFGLGTGKTSVPSILSSQGLVADSFSMCFGFDVGRIKFGDKGSSDQEETPFNLMQQSPWYNVSVTQLSVGGNLSSPLDFTAIINSGTSYTFLSEPAYTALCDTFDSQTQQKRKSSDPGDLLEYCYEVSSDSTEFLIPNVTLIMKGGSRFNVYNPMVTITTNGTVTAYCLGVIKTSTGNFIGNYFMTGHKIVFNREKMVLGWKASNLAPSPMSTDAISPTASPSSTDEIPPTVSVPPGSVNDGTPKNGLNSKAPQYLIASSLLVLFLPILQIV